MALAIDGLRSGSSGGNTLTVGPGTARDATDTTDITIPAGETRTVNVTTSGAGGVIGSAVAANTSYALYVAVNTSTNAVSCAISTDFTLTGVPGFKVRRIGSALTNQSSQIVAFTQTGTSNDRTVDYDASPPVLTLINGLGATSFTDYDYAPPKPVTATLLRLNVAPSGGSTTLSSSPPGDFSVVISTTSTLGITAPLGSTKGSFKTDTGATTTVRATGYGEAV